MNKRIKKKKHKFDLRPVKKEFFKKYVRLKYHLGSFCENAILTVFNNLDEQEKIKFCESFGINYYDYVPICSCIKSKDVL